MRRPQFTLRALLVATALVGTGIFFAKLAINDMNDNGFLFTEAAISAFGASAGSLTNRPQVWVVAGLLVGPVLGILAMIYMTAAIIFD